MAEIKNLDAVASLEAMDAHVDDWRDATKGKQRGIFSFDDGEGKICRVRSCDSGTVDGCTLWGTVDCKLSMHQLPRESDEIAGCGAILSGWNERSI